jgi:ATP adenylyltransferase
MNNEVPVEHCRFCEKFGHKSSSETHPVFDRILWENDRFLIVPAWGCLVEGYLLAITKKHYYSIANLPPAMLLELSEIKEAMRRTVTRWFTAPIFFEHGPVCKTNRAGSCIDHAHLHCVPVDFDLVPQLRSSHQVTKIEKLEDIAKQTLVDRSYIYFENQEQEKYILEGDSVPSQYFRRIIARQLGIPDQWNWALFPFKKKAQATLKTLESVQLIV